MRLIDADELIDHVYRERLDSRELIAQMVECAPTIEPERKKGKWSYTSRTNIYGGREIVCSECGESFMISPMTQNHLYECERFCCRCGARMEEGGE